MAKHTVTRRELLIAGGVLSAAAVSAAARVGTADAAGFAVAQVPRAVGWYAPADHVPHTRTWMAWPARRDIWGNQLEGARQDIARIARAITRYEPVSLVVRPDQARDASAQCGKGVEIVQLVNDDCWMRDMGPLFLINGSGDLAGVDLNFNGWGNKQVHVNDALIAQEVLERLGIPRFVAPFVSEGGALEVDGNGTVMATESSIINRNRNFSQTKAQLTTEICEFLGAYRVIWVRGLRGQDITDDHIDGLARFVGPAHVVVDQPANPDAQGPWADSERQALTVLENSSDANGQTLECVISRESSTIPPHRDPNSFVNVYVNWYVCNSAVLLPAFGDEASDGRARALVAALYPDREVVQLRIDALAAGGGGIHCVTQQQPSPLTSSS